MQDKPQLFSTVLMWLLAELFEELPEVGDLDKPKLVFFFDEAHLLFRDATKAFLESVTQTVRLIRSKGVGVFFVTQIAEGRARGRAGPARQPRPARAARVHAGRREVAQGGGLDLPELGVLRPRRAAHADGHRRGGRDHPVATRACPTPVVHTRLRAPASRMAPADDVDGAAKASPLFAKYGTRVDAESAREMLAARMEKAAEEKPASRGREPKAEHKQAAKAAGGRRRTRSGTSSKSREGKAIQKKVMRGVFGMLKKRL